MPWTVEQWGYIFSVTIAGFPVLDSAIGNGFLHASVGLPRIIHTSRQRSVMAETTVTHAFVLIVFHLQNLRLRYY